MADTRPALPPQQCAVCREMFVGKKPRKGKRAPIVCGRVLCWAIAFWGPEEWAGRKRMAEALNAALAAATPEERARTMIDPTTGLERYIYPRLEDIDMEAMRRG